jgi:hypothetical protein
MRAWTYSCLDTWHCRACGWLGGCLSEDVELRELLEGVAAAGSVGCLDGGVLKKLVEATCCWGSLLQTSSNCHW